jgi:hypothetical protein
MLEQVCFEHHAHDDTCFVDREKAHREHLAWVRAQCEAGWPVPGWGAGPATAPKQHRAIVLDAEWNYCPLCGRQIR